MGGGSGGESGRMTSEQFFFAAITGLQFFFWECAVQIIFIVIFFSEGEGEC